jgi:hypothetical protein
MTGVGVNPGGEPLPKLFGSRRHQRRRRDRFGGAVLLRALRPRRFGRVLHRRRRIEARNRRRQAKNDGCGTRAGRQYAATDNPLAAWPRTISRHHAVESACFGMLPSMPHRPCGA